MDVVNLFGVKVSDGSQLNVNKVFDVYDVIRMSKNVSEDKVIHQIKQFSKKEKEKVEILYSRMYDNCLSKINIYFENKKYCMRFKIPQNDIQCSLYNPLECLEYIQKKLNNRGIATHIRSQDEIFVSWKELMFKEEKVIEEKHERKHREKKHKKI